MRKKAIAYSLFLLMLCVCCIIYYHKVVHMYPAYMHAWAQADRLSLAISFHDRGMNFFKPATQNLYATNGITGVEFPLLSYSAAAFGKLFGREYINLCFRLLTILFTCTGLFFLFLTCYRVTKDLIISALPAIFLFCSPVFVYYSGTYMPDTAATSVVFIAFYFIFSYFEKPGNKKLITAIVLLTLASLIKTSACYCLIAFAATLFIWQLKKRVPILHNISKMLVFIPSLAVIIAYFYYNKYLNETYHSTLFLAVVNPFSGFADVQAFYKDRFLPLWMKEYLLIRQYYILAVLLLPTIFFCIRAKNGRIHLVHFLFLLSGSCGLIYLFGKQFREHDYYIIAMAMPTVAYLLVSGVIYSYRYISSRRALLISIRALMLLLFAFLLIPSVKQAESRTSPGYFGSSYGQHWAVKARKTLDSLNLPESTEIALLDEDPPNLALVYFDRRGYNIAPSTWANNIINANSILNDKQVRIMVCRGELGKNLHETYMDTCCFTPIIINDEIAVFWKKRLPPIKK